MAYTVGSHVRAAKDLTDKAGVTIAKDTPGVVTSIIKTGLYSVKFDSWPVDFVCVDNDLVPDGPVRVSPGVKTKPGKTASATISSKESARKQTAKNKATAKPSKKTTKKPATKKATKKKPTKRKPRG